MAILQDGFRLFLCKIQYLNPPVVYTHTHIQGTFNVPISSVNPWPSAPVVQLCFTGTEVKAIGEGAMPYSEQQLESKLLSFTTIKANL